MCELTYAIGASQTHMSRHLAHLRQLGIVSDRRQGLWIHYRINPELPHWAQAVLRAAVTGVGDADPFSRDEKLLSSMPNRPGAARCA